MYAFYSKTDARKWIKTAEFPLVFKLRGGSGATNVKLVQNIKHAEKLINRSFGKGFLSIDRIQNIKERLYKLRKSPNTKNIFYVLKGLVRYFIPTETEIFSIYHKGYIYFQNFIPNNNYDTRVEVIGNRCTAIRRYNRKNDFRTSGSGDWDFDKQLFDKEMIKLAFEITGN